MRFVWHPGTLVLGFEFTYVTGVKHFSFSLSIGPVSLLIGA